MSVFLGKNDFLFEGECGNKMKATFYLGELTIEIKNEVGGFVHSFSVTLPKRETSELVRWIAEHASS